MVPIDRSDSSLRAVEVAIATLASKPGSAIVLLNVQNLSTLALADGAAIMPPDWIERAEKAAAHDALKGAAELCSKAGVPFTARFRSGGIARTIVETAREEGAAQIVMGTRGLGGVRGLLLGSTATQVVHLADMPVTLVK